MVLCRGGAVRRIVLSVVVAGVLSVAACGSSSEQSTLPSVGSPNAGATSSAPTSPAVRTEGSVADPGNNFVQYPNGLRGQITAVSARPDDGTHQSDQHPDFDELVTVTLQLTNTGNSPVQLNTDALGPSQVDLYYGENRYEAQGWVTEKNGIQDLPQQLVPGTSAKFDQDFTLPSSGMAVLAVKFQPESSYPPFVFTDVQTLIH